MAGAALDLQTNKLPKQRSRRMFGTSATLLVAAASLVLVCSSPSVGHADGLPRPLPLRMSTTGYERRGWERSLLLPALRGGSSRADGGAAAAVGADFDADDLTGLQDSSDIPSEGTVCIACDEALSAAGVG